MPNMILNKTAHFRRVEFLYEESDHQENNLSLSDLLAQLKDNYEKQNYLFRYGVGLECIVVYHEETDGFQLVHLVTFEEGAGAAIISSNEGANLHEVDEVTPPENNEFVKSQLFIICKGNDIVWVSHTSALRAGSVKLLLNSLLEEFHPKKDLPNLLLSAPVNNEAFKQLIHEGIASIDLQIHSSRHQLEFIKENGKVPASIFSFLKTDNIGEDSLDAASKLKSVVTLKPGRAWGIPNVRVLLENISREMIEETDDDKGFVIRTKHGHKLTKEDMTITWALSVSGNAQTLDTEKTFDALKSAFRSMTNAVGD